MSISGIRVKILGVVNPHLIWIDKYDDELNGPVQISLIGLFPVTSSRDDEKTYNQWSHECIEYLKHEVDMALEAYFVPLVYDDNHSLFKDTSMIYGKLRLKRLDKSVIVMNQTLIDNNMAKYCWETFEKFKACKKFVVSINNDTLEHIKKRIFAKGTNCAVSGTIIFNTVSINYGTPKEQALQEKRYFSKHIDQMISKVENDKKKEALEMLKLHKATEFDHILGLANEPIPTVRHQNKIVKYKLQDPQSIESLTKFQEKSNPAKEHTEISKIPEGYYVHTSKKEGRSHVGNRYQENRRNNNYPVRENKKFDKSQNYQSLSQVNPKQRVSNTKDNYESRKNYSHPSKVSRSINEQNNVGKNPNCEKSPSKINTKQNLSNSMYDKHPLLKHAIIDDDMDLSIITKSHIENRNPVKNISSPSEMSKKNLRVSNEHINSSTSECDSDKIKSDTDDPDLAMSDNDDEAKHELPNTPIIFNKFMKISKKECPSPSVEKYVSIESPLSKATLNGPSLNLDKLKNPTEGTLVDTITVPKLLIHSRRFKKIERWLYIRNTSFPKEIVTNIGLRKPMSSQTAVWPAAMLGCDVFTVGPPKSGKTLGFLMPLCSLIMNMNESSTEQKTHGPAALIISPNTISAMYIESRCNMLLKNSYNAHGLNYRVLRIDSNSSDLENMTNLFTGCDILIASPAIINFTMYKYSGFDLQRISMLLFCECDKLEKYFYNETIKLYEMCKDVAAKRSEIDRGLQLFMSSRNWCNLMESMAKSDSATIIINSFQECILYSKIKLTLNFALNSHKKQQILDYLNNCKNVFGRKYVIICENDNEATSVSQDIDEKLYHVIVANTKMNLEQNEKLLNEWRRYDKSSRGLILICCDCNLPYLNITDAHHLINFSLPSLFSTFYQRFYLLNDTYPNIWNNHDPNDCRVDICIDENDYKQIPLIIDYAQRCGIEFPEEILSKVKSIINIKEHTRAVNSVPLCKELLTFGTCSAEKYCLYRHSIWKEFDTLNDWIPKTGTIKFKIIHIHDLSHYSIRLLEHTSLDGRVKIFTQRYLNFILEMSMYYLNKDNIISYKDYKLGDICAVQLKSNAFHRCQIIKQVSKCILKIRLIDEERCVDCNVNDLYQLPDDFKSVNNNVLKVRLACVKPKDGKDSSWINKDNPILQKILSTDVKRSFMRGRIVLGLRNTLWIESMQLCQALQSHNRVVVRSTVKNELIKNGFAVNNPNHITLLYDLCKSEMQLPEYVPKSIAMKNTFKPEFVYLHSDVIYEAYFLTGSSPDSFFMRLKQHEDKLISLNNDIEKYVSEYSVKSYDIYDVGDYCIAQFTDGKYYRARIDRIDKSEILYKCFFVDFGDYSETKSVFPITSKFVKQLPFLAFECKLYGIEPFATDDWTEESTDFLYDFCYEPGDENVFKTVYVKSFEKDVSNKYSIAIFDCTTLDNIINLNHLFVKDNIAAYIASEKELLDSVGNDELIYFVQSKMKIESEVIKESFARVNKHIEKLNIVDFDVEGESDSEADEWDVNFEPEDYVYAKKLLTPDAPFDLIDMLVATRSRSNVNNNDSQLIEVPRDFKESNLDDIFQDAEEQPK